MIHKIEITNHLGQSVELELMFPEKSGFIVQRIDGLGPAKANINNTELAGMDGAIFNSSRLLSRNIVLDIKFLPGSTIEDTRLKSYKYFPTKNRVELKITSNTRVCKTFGYVESNEVNIFSNAVYTQISIICPDPYFYAIDPSVVYLAGIHSVFEFPFSNESLVSPLLEFSQIDLTTINNVEYTGEISVGMLIHIHALGVAENITLYNEFTLETMEIDTDKLLLMIGGEGVTDGIIAGDDIFINTVIGKKSAILLREGVYYNILNALNKDADWFQLSKGPNVIGFICDAGADNLQIKIEHETLYEGV